MHTITSLKSLGALRKNRRQRNPSCEEVSRLEGHRVESVFGWDGLEGEAQTCFAPFFGKAVVEGERAAVGLGDLAAQRQADAGTARLGGEEGDEDVGGVLDAGSVVENPDVQLRILAGPADARLRAGVQDGIGGIVQQ